MKRFTEVEKLRHALAPFIRAYEMQCNPGTSDLDNEQPMTLRVTLGDCRRAAFLAPTMRK